MLDIRGDSMKMDVKRSRVVENGNFYLLSVMAIGYN